jgi:hypothetical protein
MIYGGKKLLSNRKKSMPGVYSLPRRKARICRVAGATFLFFAACSLLGALSAAVVPGPNLNCVESGCGWTLQPARLLGEDRRAEVLASPAATRRFDAYTAQPPVRLGLGVVMLIRNGPFAMLLLGVGLALRRLGARNGDPLADALPWLRFASLAAIASAFAGPIGASLLESLLSRGTPDGPHWIIVADFGEVGTGLLLAVAAYASAWALEAGVGAQRDLDSFV